MREQADATRIRRILVALDASRHSLAALEAAADLASRLQAELRGLYVEDINLLRIARSPVAREVQYPFITNARLDQHKMERQLHAQAAQARRALAETSEARKIKWSFRTVRGEVAAEVLAAAAEVDMLSIGTASRPLLRRVQMGSTAKAAAESAPCCVLILQHKSVVKPPVVIVYDGSPAAERALMRAARLVQRKWGFMIILVEADTMDEAHQLQTQASDSLKARRIMVRYKRLAHTNLRTLARQMRIVKGGMLVLSSTTLSQEDLQNLLNQVASPVLLVR